MLMVLTMVHKCNEMVCTDTLLQKTLWWRDVDIDNDRCEWDKVMVRCGVR